MNSYLKVALRLGWLLIILAGVFLLLAALRVTTISWLVLAGLAFTWIVLGLLLLWIARRTTDYMSERGEDFDFEMKPPQFKLRRKKEEAEAD